MTRPVICLTGASGFLGRYLAEELGQKYSVRAISNHPVNVPGVRESRVGNLKDDEFLRKAARGSYAIVHAAAITNTLDPMLEEINIKYTKKLVQAAKNCKIKKFVYISTENATHHCKDPYTKSKIKAEHIVLASYPEALILRPALIFGKRDTRTLASFAKAIRSFPIVPVFSKRHCTLQPIYAEDVAKFVHQGLKLNKKGTYTLVGTEPKTFAEIGKIIAKHSGKKRVFLTIPMFLIRIAISLLRFGPIELKRLHYRLQNAFVLRQTNKRKIEQAFKYNIPPLEARLKDL